MPTDIHVQQGDERPTRIGLTNLQGLPDDLTGSALLATMYPADGGTAVMTDAIVTIVDEDDGICDIGWTAGATATPGDYEMVVVDSTGGESSWVLSVCVRRDLG